MNPYAIIAALVLAVGALGGSYFAGRKDGRQLEVAAQAKADEVAKLQGEAMTTAAVTAIQGLEKIYVPIKQKGEVVTREVPVYRDCVHDPRGLQAINEALAGREQGSDPAGVPNPDPAN